MPSSVLASQVQFIVGMLLVATLAAIATQRIRVPYTVTLVVLGLAAQLLGILPQVHLTPELVMVVFLPALLFEAAWNLDIPTLAMVWRPASILAVLGVLIAVLGIAAAVHLGDSLPWSSALLLGAALSATDPVSVVAIFRKVKAPRTLATLVEAESLFNDGTGVAIYQVLLAAVATGHLGLARLGSTFVYVSLGGLGVGLAIGFFATLFLAYVHDHLAGVMLTTVAAYGSFLLGDRLGVSPVLTVVAVGLVMGNASRGKLGLRQALSRKTARLGLLVVRRVPSEINLAIDSFWEYAAFVANSLLFLMVGLEFVAGPVFDRASPFLWAVAGMLGARAVALALLLPLRRQRPDWRQWPVLFWGGLRGALSLAMALGLPEGFPERDTIIAVVYGCVLFTLVVQGLTIPWLVRAVLRPAST